MNIFFIPSWYPTESNPYYGIFIKEQIVGLANQEPELNCGISLWGQGEESHLLWFRDHIKNLLKIIRFQHFQSLRKKILENCSEYYHPSLTWTRRILQGNRKNILKANKANFDSFTQEHGRVDLIHAQAIYPAGYIAQYLSEAYKVPFILTARMSPFPFEEFVNGTETNPIVAEPMHKAHHIVSISQSLKNKIKSLGYRQTTVLHNFTDENSFTPQEVKLNEEFTFLFAGRLVEQKGLDVLLDAMYHLQTDQFKLKIVGEGPEEKNLKEKAKALNLQNKVEWLQFLPRDLLALEIQMSHCIVLPSRHETLGNILIEGIACGKPVISTRCGGPEDIVNSVNGLLAEINDSEDLAMKMSYMFENYDNYSSNLIYDDFVKRFSRKVISSQFKQLYQEVIDHYPQTFYGKLELDH